MKKLKKDYWNKFYKKKKAPQKSSSFAVFCTKFLKDKNEIIYDLGCGNGRDTVFFLKKNFRCIGFDQSKTIINNNKKKHKNYKDFFYCKDFSKVNFSKINKEKFSIYSRFSLHAINSYEEKTLIKNIIRSKNIRYLMIETRTIYDELFGVGKKISQNEYITDHYRRFVNPIEIKKKLNKNFKLIYYFLGKNVAKYKKENPKILRLIYKNVR